MRLLHALLRRCLGVLLRANTGPVDALLYAYAVSWLAFLALVPDAAYVHIHAWGVLQVKEIWVWPALVAVLLTPAGWASDWDWLHLVSRVYKVAWWLFVAVATAMVAPSVVIFWLPACCNVVGGFWLLAREGADDVRARDAR